MMIRVAYGRGVKGVSLLIEDGAEKVMLDAGTHPKNPFLNVDPILSVERAVKALAISHAHLDHAGLVPLVECEKAYMTHPTLALLKLIIPDFVSVSRREHSLSPYPVGDAVQFFKRVSTVWPHQEVKDWFSEADVSSRRPRDRLEHSKRNDQ